MAMGIKMAGVEINFLGIKTTQKININFQWARCESCPKIFNH